MFNLKRTPNDLELGENILEPILQYHKRNLFVALSNAYHLLYKTKFKSDNNVAPIFGTLKFLFKQRYPVCSEIKTWLMRWSGNSDPILLFFTWQQVQEKMNFLVNYIDGSQEYSEVQSVSLRSRGFLSRLWIFLCWNFLKIMKMIIHKQTEKSKGK